MAQPSGLLRRPLAAALPASPIRLLPLSLLLALGVLWGLPFILSKLASQSGVPPSGYALWQCLGAALLVGLLATWRGEKLQLTPRYLRFYAVTGTLGVTLPLANMYYVLAHVPAGVVAITVATIPVFTYCIALLVRLESVAAGRAGGILLGFAGVLLVLLPRIELPASGVSSWTLLGFVTPLSYACCHVYVGRARPADATGASLTVGMLLAAALALIPLLAATDGWYLPSLQPNLGEAAILGQILISSLGYLLVFELIRIAGPVYFSQVGYLVTVSGLILAATIFHERYPASLWAALALIFAGVYLVSLKRRVNRE